MHNKSRKFRSQRRSKRKFAGNRFVTANRDPVEEEATVVQQNFTMPANENQDEIVGRLGQHWPKRFTFTFLSISCQRYTVGFDVPCS